MGYRIDVDPNDIDQQIRVYLYLYHIVSQHVQVKGLHAKDLKPQNGPVSKMLSELFNKHSIEGISLTFIEGAYDIANKWLLDEQVSEGEVSSVIEQVDAQRRIIRPAVEDIYALDEVDENFLGGPLVIAAIGNARQLAEMTLEFSQIEDEEQRHEVFSRILDKVSGGIRASDYGNLFEPNP